MKADNFGRMLAFGVGTMVTLQALINIAVATVSVPTKGLSLPLVSGGKRIDHHLCRPRLAAQHRAIQEPGG